MRKKIFRQFNNKSYKDFNLLFVLNQEDGCSRAKGIANLFGWGDETFLRQYTSRFKLELVYG